MRSPNTNIRVGHQEPGRRDLLVMRAGLLPGVELVHDHLHDLMAAGGTVLEVAVAPVGAGGRGVSAHNF